MRPRPRRIAFGLLLMSLWLVAPSAQAAASAPTLQLSTALYSAPPAPAPAASQRAPLPLQAAASVRRSLIRLALSEGKAMLGTDYVLGANDDDAVDCSSLVQRMFQAVGKKMPRTARQQLAVGRPVQYDERAPGDLLFYRWGPSGLHVAVYLDRGRILHASTGAGKVVVSDLTPAWHRRLVSARRLI